MEFILEGLPQFYTSVGADRVAWLSGSTVVQSEVASPAQALDDELWHHRFSHLSHGRLKSLVEHKMVLDQVLPSVPPASSIPICSACSDGKQTQDSFPLTASHRSIPLELVHSDLHGLLPATVNGYKYWQQNGVAERTNRIDEGASPLSDLHFPACFWGALSCFLHTLGCSPSAALLGQTPFKLFYQNPSISMSLAAGLMPMCRRTSRVPLPPSPGSVYSLDIRLIIRAGSVGIRLQVMCSYPESTL